MRLPTEFETRDRTLEFCFFRHAGMMVIGLSFEVAFVGLGLLADAIVTVMFAAAAVLTLRKGLSFRRSRLEKMAARKVILEGGRETL